MASTGYEVTMWQISDHRWDINIWDNINYLYIQICDPNAVPSIVRETSSTALVDGNNSLGAVVGNYAMNLAITKAKETGVAWVTVRFLQQG